MSYAGGSDDDLLKSINVTALAILAMFSWLCFKQFENFVCNGINFYLHQT